MGWKKKREAKASPALAKTRANRTTAGVCREDIILIW